MTPSIRNITIIGPGAMGAIFASILHDMGVQCVSFIADGERYERLQRHGVTVNGKHYAIPVFRPQESPPHADLMIVAVKHHQLDAAIRDMESSIGEHTCILSVMNGIESEERIGAVHGMDKVLYAVSVGIDAVREGSHVTYASQGKLLFGEAANENLSERVRRIQVFFDGAGVVYETPRDMIRTLWWKFMINVGINQASAALRGPYSLFQSSKEARELMESAMREVMVLAGKEKVHLTETDLENWYTVLANLNPHGKTSMLQDVEAGRKTEVEIFAGKVIELGKRHGVPTPVNRELFALIREIEASTIEDPATR